MFKNATAAAYAEARANGDRAEADRLRGEAIARFATRTTDGTEIAEMGEASMTIAWASGRTD